MTIQENIPLNRYTTFGIGGPARYFAEVSTDTDAIEAIRWATSKNIRIFVLGGGSNLLMPDKGFDGLVLKPSFYEISIDATSVNAGSSILLSDLIDKTLAHGLTGMEFAAGIPGTLGGAIRGNAGTYGVGMSDVLTEVCFIDESTLSNVVVPASECGFSYRHSKFKEHTHVITQATLTLSFGDIEASRKIIDEQLTVRHTNHPAEPSAGCVFKNIEFSKAPLDTLAQKGISLAKFEAFQKIPSGYLIEQLGLKGKTIGGAKISERHANYIVNTGSATSEDVVTLISYIKQQVRDEYGVQLQEEIHIVD